MNEKKNYLNYDPSTGKILGFYNSLLFEEAAVPNPKIEITDETLVMLQTTGRHKVDPATLAFIKLEDAAPDMTDSQMEAELTAAIEAATTLEELKSALLGKTGKTKIKAIKK